MSLRPVPRADGRNVLDVARERFDRLFAIHDHVAVAFSGGKDSTVVLNLALEAAERAGRLPLDVTHVDEECIAYETEDYIRRVYNDPRVRLAWWCVEVKHRNACSPTSPYWYPWDSTIVEKWTRPLPPEGLTTGPAGFIPRVHNAKDLNEMAYGPQYGTRALVLGIRAQESMMRLRSVLARTGDDHYVMSRGGGLYSCSPIFDWKTEDVWRAPRIMGWDYNSAYDRMDEAGMSKSQQRCAPPFGEEPLGNLWMFKVCFPELWDKMHDRVPGAATAARYARTELYGYRGRPPKPEGVTWEQHIKKFVLKFRGEDRRLVAQRVASVLNGHAGVTTDPILDSTPHPLTGVSWDYILKIAMRGNFKGRATPPIPSTGAAREAAQAKYDAARIAEGK